MSDTSRSTVSTPESPASTPAAKSSRWSEMAQVIILTLAIVIPIRLFFANPFKVQGASMEPSFFDKEYLIIDEISYRLEDPKRGEVVVFRPPTDQSKFFIKRVIGLPGDTVELVNGMVKIYNQEHPNGWTLDESSYIDVTEFTVEQKTSMTMRPVTLGEGEYFVMGDNRIASYDSRYFGPIKGSTIVGRAVVRGWPVHRWGAVNKLPDYAEPAS